MVNWCNFSDFPTQASEVPYFWPNELPAKSDDGLHLIICVHGLDGETCWFDVHICNFASISHRIAVKI